MTHAVHYLAPGSQKDCQVLINLGRIFKPSLGTGWKKIILEMRQRLLFTIVHFVMKYEMKVHHQNVKFLNLGHPVYTLKNK